MPTFNESRLVTVWSGFSVKWYVQLFRGYGESGRGRVRKYVHDAEEAKVLGSDPATDIAVPRMRFGKISEMNTQITEPCPKACAAMNTTSPPSTR